MTCIDPTDTRAAVDAALILAGGRSTRLGVDKPEQLVGGRRLLDAALEAVAGAHTIVVGPERRVPPFVQIVRESPVAGGPLAAIAAGVGALPMDARTVAVLAADLPEVDRRTVDQLAALRAFSGSAVALAEDLGGRAQFLLAVWSASELRAALESVQRLADTPVRAIIPRDAPRLRLHTVDVDTPDDLRRARKSPECARNAVRSGLEPIEVCLGPPRTGSILAQPVTASMPFPPFDQSAMDGWAVSGAPPWSAVEQPVLAGHVPPPLAAGAAVRISTGARLPEGADRVVREEEVTIVGDVVDTANPGRDDVRRRGSAWSAGDRLADAGTPVDWALASTLTSAAVIGVRARGPVRIRLHTSGDEIGHDGGAGLPETASLAVAGILEQCAAAVTRGEHVPDRPESFARALSASGAAVVVIIGATGRGSADHLRAALLHAKAEVLVDGIDIRPGGSVLVAALPDGRVVLGLAGNPMAAVAGAALLGPVVCASLLGAKGAPLELIEIADPNPDGRWRVVPVAPDGAGRWRVPGNVATAHLRDAIGCRALALVAPHARVGDLAERLT